MCTCNLPRSAANLITSITNLLVNLSLVIKFSVNDNNNIINLLFMIQFYR